jgi:hypothetical protein
VVCKRTDSPTMDCLDVCLETLYCKNGSECSKVATRGPVGRTIGVSVPRTYRSDVYVCSKSFRLCLTVVY